MSDTTNPTPTNTESQTTDTTDTNTTDTNTRDTNTRDTNTTDTNTRDTPASAGAGWKIMHEALHALGIIGLIIALIIVAVAMYGAALGLGALFKIDRLLATATALAVAIVWLAHGTVAAFTKSNTLRFWNGIGACVWLFLAVALTTTHSIMRLVGINETMTVEQMTNLLRQGASVVPADLIVIGRIAYACLIALAAITLSASLFAAIGQMRPIKDKHGTLGNVAASAGVTIVIVAAALYGGLHVFTYGVTVLGLDPFTAGAASVLAELTFIAAAKRALETGRWYYVALAALAIGYSLGINWLEGRTIELVKLAPTPQAGKAAVANFLATNSLARVASDLYALAGVIFALALVAVEYISHRESGKPTGPTVTPDAKSRPNPFDWLSRLADMWQSRQTRFNRDVKTPKTKPKRDTNEDTDDDDNNNERADRGTPRTPKRRRRA